MGEKPKLFGTDGVRGVAGKYPLDPANVYQLGRAVGAYLSKADSGSTPRVLLGEDTRESSAWISRRLAAGLRASGTQVFYAGVITTPGIACLTRKHGFEAGLVVSASHNPYQDNGIKVLGRSGMKLTEPQELEIEQKLQELGTPPSAEPEAELTSTEGLVEEYVDQLADLVPHAFGKRKVSLVADGANGAAWRTLPLLFKKAGIDGHVLNSAPDGRNINLRCGALHPEEMARATRSAGAELGVAFDGDADRAIFATSEGRVADGDHVLYAAALHLQETGKLRGDAIIGTLMTNLGLEVALEQRGIGLRRTAVGDKYVLEEMLRSGANLGGEPSGHIIFGDISLAGDGLITLLMILSIMNETGKSFGELVAGLRQFPQIIRNVHVRAREPLESFPEISRAIAEGRQDLGSRGRVVVRYSGTERLARVMVEGEDAETVHRHAARISEAIDSVLGVGAGK
jgi:phosphoglucosamine mutase